MYSIRNLIKSILVSCVVSAGYTFYWASTSFQKAVGIHQDPDIGRIAAFISASKNIEPFWPHILMNGATSFVMLLTGCGVLLAFVRPPQKVN